MEKKIIHKGYKFRLYPNEEQKTFIHKSIGSCRFVYNYFLGVKTKYYADHKTDTKKSLSFVETEHLLAVLKLVNGCTGGYRKNDCWNQPCKQFKYVIDLAKKFSLKLNISVDKILDIWEQNRRYNIYNFYQKYREGDL